MFKGNEFICSVPFSDLEVMEGYNHLCCYTWLPKRLPKLDSLKSSWNSKEAKDIRDSILDGSYRYCDKSQCPYIAHVTQEGTVSTINSDIPLFHKTRLPQSLKEKIEKYKEGSLLPSTLHFSFDATCNLKCPSCRIEILTSSREQIKAIELTIEDIETNFASNIDTLYITGSGDPFASPSFRKFLRNFNKKRYPKLNKIHLHTNATRWTPKMWDSMKNIHPYVKTCEISIDAGTKETYENYTRLGGKWDRLIENLHFISKLDTLKLIRVSFVVQQSNYKEMKIFYDLMLSIFGKKVVIFYSKINDWGTGDKQEFLSKKIWDKNHPEHEEFLYLLNELLPRKQTYTNMQDLLVNNKNVI